MTTCSVDGCYRSAKCRGWCMTHYNRIRRHGDPDHAPCSPSRPHFKVDPETGCWNWLRANSGDGHGYGAYRGTTAHRAYWELVYGPLPKTIELDHLCRNTACVNPAHLDPVPSKVNLMRSDAPAAVNARKTHCANGHEFTPENIYRPPSRPNSRMCRTCLAERDRRGATLTR